MRARLAPLVHFVTTSKRGYCQHFAGAMALMLRYLGIPARVAAGFSSGVYDEERKQWTVYDRDAHTWVEVWFNGYGWLPFDPDAGAGHARRAVHDLLDEVRRDRSGRCARRERDARVGSCSASSSARSDGRR